MATAEEILEFSLKSLEEMNFNVEGMGPETVFGPTGVDVDSLAFAELVARLEDRFDVSFPDDEVEQLTIITIGEFADAVAQRTVSA
jgi:acyl carrier protein